LDHISDLILLGLCLENHPFCPWGLLFCPSGLLSYFLDRPSYLADLLSYLADLAFLVDYPFSLYHPLLVEVSNRVDLSVPQQSHLDLEDPLVFCNLVDLEICPLDLLDHSYQAHPMVCPGNSVSQVLIEMALPHSCPEMASYQVHHGDHTGA